MNVFYETEDDNTISEDYLREKGIDNREKAKDEVLKKGVLNLSKGIAFQGGLKEGKPSGYGTLIIHKTKYEGHWENGCLCGKVKCLFGNGDKYEGEIKNGKPHGIGTFTWASGGSYHGSWKNGEYHGKGLLTFPHGCKLRGVFKDGEFCS